MPERLCRHEPCGCEPAPTSPYCAPHCEQAAARAEQVRGRGDRPDRCECGHPACNPKEAERFSSGEAPVP